MTLLSKSAILCVNDLQTENVEVPKCVGAVRVRSFTGRERDAFEGSMVRGEGKDRKLDPTNTRARLVGLPVIDEGGQRLFTYDEVDLLGAKSGAALDRVFAIAQKLNERVHLAASRVDGGSIVNYGFEPPSANR